jgi:hypothetical protein
VTLLVCTLLLLAAPAGAAVAPAGAPLPPAPDWIAELDQGWAHLGQSVASAGDVNGDGYDDLVAGAMSYDAGQIDEGAAFLYQGSPDGLDTQAAWSAEGDQGYAYLGRSVAGAGDVNGDGYDDVLVGAPGYDDRESDEGRVLLYLGAAGGLSAAPAWTVVGGQAYADLGWSVAGAGDLDGDGYDDVVVGAPFYDSGAFDEGQAWVFYGSPTGLSPTPGWRGESDQEGAFFGFSVAGGGDTNGDGYGDLLVGAYGYDNPLEREGRAYLFYGSASGLAPAAGWTAESGQAGSCFALAVAGAGDVNGDGYADLAVGAYLYDHVFQDEGGIFVYLGSDAGPSPEPDWAGYGGQQSAFLGFAVGAAGDLDADGFGDLAAGAHCYDDGQLDEGRALVYLGSGAGLRALPDWSAEGDQESAHFGRPARTAGDVNGDGAADLVVGASNYDGGQTDEGAVFVFHGIPEGAALHLFKMKLGWKPGARPGQYRVGSAVVIHDQDHALAPAVTATGTWTDPDGTVTNQAAVTNPRGQARFLLKGKLAGTYQFCLTGLARAGYADDPAGDHAPRCQSIQVGP